jgi:HEAT repeat protein
MVFQQDDPELLTALMRLLASVGTPKHARAARAHLNSPEFFVRAAATRTLSELGTEEDLPLLLEVLDDPSPWVKLAAAKGIYRLGGKAALTALAQHDDPTRTLFRQVLSEEAWA